MRTQHFDHLIVGGGMSADAAAKAIREREESATIGILGGEAVPPFPRPALSKKLWTDPSFSREDASLATAEETGATLVLGSRVTSIDTEARVVGCDTGETYGYERLLLATGGYPRVLAGVEPGDRVIYFRTLPDYEQLRALAAERPRVAVVGGGYIGCEIAAALAQHECTVTLVTPDDELGAAMFPVEVTSTLRRAFDEAGITVRTGTLVTGVDDSAVGQRVRLDDGTAFEADVVVLGLGIEPSSAYVPASIETAADGGIRVGPDLRTTAEHVWAAGDVAEYPDRILGRRRVEHVDNATTMGAAAGRMMAGSQETYDHTPMFYSDLFDHWYEAVGTLDSSLTTVVDAREGGATVVYYLDDDAVRGVLLWDCDGGLEEAKAVLAGDRPSDPGSLRGTIPG